MRALVVGVVMLLGCHVEPTGPPDWIGDERFTEAERAEIQRGADWLYANAGLPPPRIEWHGEPTIRREHGPGGEDGLCAGGVVYLGDYRYLAGLTAHEMAHCVLGFQDGYRGERHSDGIMRVLEPMVWSEDEQAQCREHADRCPAGR